MVKQTSRELAFRRFEILRVALRVIEGRQAPDEQ